MQSKEMENLAVVKVEEVKRAASEERESINKLAFTLKLSHQ